LNYQGTPLLILANKQDLPMAKEPKELEKLLGLHELLTPISSSFSTGTLASIDGSLPADKSIAPSSSSAAKTTSDQNALKTWHIQPTCAITGEGLHEGLDSLYDLIIRKRKMQKQKKKR
jgi:ADP-ribosylation factor-like protein 4